MAKLPPEVREMLWNLQRQTLEIVEEATATEYTLFDMLGETETTFPYLDEMKNVAEEAETSYSRLSRLHLQVTQAQPIPSNNLLEFLQQSISRTEIRIFAWKRSIQEVKQEWNLQ
ncbi:MAG: hypothetical protein AB4058_00985 [Microcystaceae cyanobacterium]